MAFYEISFRRPKKVRIIEPTLCCVKGSKLEKLKITSIMVEELPSSNVFGAIYAHHRQLSMMERGERDDDENIVSSFFCIVLSHVDLWFFPCSACSRCQIKNGGTRDDKNLSGPEFLIHRQI